MSIFSQKIDILLIYVDPIDIDYNTLVMSLLY
jgi:hypothetical protein